MTPENMTMDELIAEGLNSINPALREICRRLSGTCAGTPEAAHNAAVSGRTVRAIEEDGNMILLSFTDGTYFVIEAEAFNDDVDFSMGRQLMRNELYRYGLMTPAEAQIYRDEQTADEAARKARRLESLRKELAELEGGE